MTKKIFKYSSVVIMSLIMFYSIILSIMGMNTKTITFTADKKIELNDIFIDGIFEDLNDYNLEKINDSYYFETLSVKYSNTSQLLLSVKCNNEPVEIYYNNENKTLCTNSNEELDGVYLNDGLKSQFINYIKQKDHLLTNLFLLIILIAFNLITFNILSKIIDLMKHNTLAIKYIILSIMLLFISYLFSFSVIMSYFKSFALIPLGLILLYALYKIKDTLKNNLENAFIIIGTICGLTMLFAIPPMHVPDEQNHFIKAYAVLKNDNKLEFANDGAVYLTLPTNINYFVKNYSDANLKYDAKYYPTTYISNLFKQANSYKEVKRNFYSQYRAKFTAYIPAILTCFICRILYFSPMIMFYCCRFINLLIFLIAGYYVIKKLPKFKSLFMLCSLLPITLHQAIGINQDSINNTLFIVLLYIIIRLIYDKDYILDKKRLAILSLLSILLTCCKTIYVAIIGLLILVPKDKIKLKVNNKFIDKIKIPLFILMDLIICYIFYKYVRIKTNTPITVVGYNNYYSIQDALNDPIRFLRIIKNTLIDRFSLDFFRGLHDGFGWSTIWSKDIIRDFNGIIYGILIFTAIDNKDKITKYHHILNILLVLVLTACLYYAMLFGWSEKNINSIDGLQSRYFIPIVYLLYMELSSLIIININEKYKNNIFITLIILGLLLSLSSIINGFI